jgi:hypothetical protein
VDSNKRIQISLRIGMAWSTFVKQGMLLFTLWGGKQVAIQL